MKVEKVQGYQNSADLILSAENPAEVALVNLFSGCDAKCELAQPAIPAETNVGMAGSVPKPDPQLKITVAIKNSRY